MPQVGVGNEPLHERLMFTYDGTAYRVVVGDTAGNIVVAQKADQNIQARGYGWYSSAWQRSPIPFGVSGRIATQFSNLSLSAGTNHLDSAAVPAGEIWVITEFTSTYVGTNPTSIYWGLRDGSNLFYIGEQLTPVSGNLNRVNTYLVFAEGDMARVSVFGATAGNDLYGRIMGFRIDIDQ